jgi:hypothetical protein
MRNHILFSAVAISVLALSACGQSGPSAKTQATMPSEAVTPGALGGGPTLTLEAPTNLGIGKETMLTLNLNDATGSPLGPDAIATSHTKKVHVMIVDAGLEDYTHVHATPGTIPGQWNVAFTPKFGRTYKVWTDFKLATENDAAVGHNMGQMAKEGHDHGDGAGAHSHDAPKKADPHPLTPSAVLRVGNEASPAVEPIQSLSGSAGGLSFTLSLGGAAKAGEHVAATLAVMDDATGQPFRGLEPIMGAYAHLVGFSADGSKIMHGHPEGTDPIDATARGGPALMFELHPEVPGPTRLFLQVQKGGQIIVVPMTLNVAP